MCGTMDKLQKKLAAWWVVFFGVFAGFFEGGAIKSALFGWCFGGEIMVLCVVNVERKRTQNRTRKIRHHFELFFGRTT
jgi:hypothetical protein